MTIDPTTDLGKLRLRCGDFSDFPYLPDNVYLQTLIDNSNNLPRSAIICATYILGMLASKTDRVMGLQLQVKGSQAFVAYKEFLLLTVTNPAFMTMVPIPYGASGTDIDPIIQFKRSWNQCYYNGTDSQQLALEAAISPNDGSLYGPLGSLSTESGQFTTGWVLV